MTSKPQLKALIDLYERRWIQLLHTNMSTVRKAAVDVEAGRSVASSVETWFQIPESIAKEYGKSVSDWRRISATLGDGPIVYTAVERQGPTGTYVFACDEDAESCLGPGAEEPPVSEPLPRPATPVTGAP